MSNLPSLVAGDFNEIIYVDENTGRARNNWQIDNFRNVLFYLGFEGPKLTSKGSKFQNYHIRARLDRGLTPASFSQTFPACRICNTSVNHSYHLALSIHLIQSTNS